MGLADLNQLIFLSCISIVQQSTILIYTNFVYLPFHSSHIDIVLLWCCVKTTHWTDRQAIDAAW